MNIFVLPITRSSCLSYNLAVKTRIKLHNDIDKHYGRCTGICGSFRIHGLTVKRPTFISS